MRYFISTIFVLLITAHAAVAQDYQCQIDQYGRPVGFAGGYQNQKDLMISWMPSKTFYMYVNDDQTILHHSGGENGRTPAAGINPNGNGIEYTFVDEPISSANRSRLRTVVIIMDQTDLSFSLFIRMGSGARIRSSGGQAWGHCQQL